MSTAAWASQFRMTELSRAPSQRLSRSLLLTGWRSHPGSVPGLSTPTPLNAFVNKIWDAPSIHVLHFSIKRSFRGGWGRITGFTKGDWPACEHQAPRSLSAPCRRTSAAGQVARSVLETNRREMLFPMRDPNNSSVAGPQACSQNRVLAYLLAFGGKSLRSFATPLFNRS
jgi:hypothetical protein